MHDWLGWREVARLRPSRPCSTFPTRFLTLASLGAERLRTMLAEREWVAVIGAMTGGQAVQMVKGNLEATYLSGWQVAADANLVGDTHPDQSLHPASSGPAAYPTGTGSNRHD